MANSSIRYGASLRKRYNSIKEKKRAAYKCDVCGREKVRRISTSIWQCRHCNTVYAGGAYTMTTQKGEVAMRLINELKNNAYKKEEGLRANEILAKEEEANKEK
ncbi:MAG: 50S ribosomal protein L37ae [Candidatus Micrarchaeia archaeon]